jgi:glucose-6-phosphate isomerase
MAGGFGRKRARGHQPVRVDANGLRRDVIGEAGLDDQALAEVSLRVADQAAALERQHGGWFSTLPPSKAVVRKAAGLAAEARGAFTDLVVIASGDLALGIGGLVAALVPRTVGADSPTEGTLRVHVLDELDPDRVVTLLTRLDLRRTLFNVVSGTGETLTTMSHFLIVRDRLLRELGAVGYRQHVVVATRAREGALRQIVNDEGFRDLVLPDGVADDAALLTPAALFPVACAGGDAGDVVAGALAMAERCRSRDAEGGNPLALLAAGLRLAAGGGLQVQTPSRGPLAELGRWIACRTSGSASAVALILDHEGPTQALEIPATYQDLESIAYLGGQEHAALAAHHREALELARWRGGRPTLTLTCPAITAHALGQVVALVDAATTVGRALGTLPTVDDDVDRLAYGLAGRPGFEGERAEVQRLAARREARYVA